MLSIIIIPLLLIMLFSALLYICILGIKDADEDTYNVDFVQVLFFSFGIGVSVSAIILIILKTISEISCL
jgi:uncharacterized RDD family membrane protein YckC